ncbi:MAG: ferredoxin [Candidatus Hydrogenedentes bacterium]|jgi:ferredoxin|nr:ferredoxin [Candidatus Hydrogenedentota bacterium]
MKAVVNENTCIGCGLCEESCPAVFEMDGSVAKVKADPVPPDQEESCRQTADLCPVEAITTEE